MLVCLLTCLLLNLTHDLIYHIHVQWHKFSWQDLWILGVMWSCVMEFWMEFSLWAQLRYIFFFLFCIDLSANNYLHELIILCFFDIWLEVDRFFILLQLQFLCRHIMIEICQLAHDYSKDWRLVSGINVGVG